ncbi:MAG: hypothetical protein P8J45_09595 [Phycisphaerales bacterium]|jgi:hypothetical protein|nr:hypothetical protein [Phycisphaerales bacterium]
MNNTSLCISGLLNDIRDCLSESDFDSARFIRDGLLQRFQYGPGWLSCEEEDLLASY